MEEIINILSNQPFAIAVCIYLLWERDRRTKELTDVVRDLGKFVRDLEHGGRN